MATETQRLIALSLGKIAASRQKRGGINLHKNLLVASVLHKARSAYMMENLQTMLAKKAQQNSESTKTGQSNQQISTQTSISNTTNLQSSAHNSLSPKRSRLETDYRVSRPCPDDKENSPPKCSKMDNENVSENVCEKPIDKCENSITHGSVNSGHVLTESQCTESKEVNDYVSSCSRCASKRRRDHDQSQSDNDNSIMIKKSRLDCDEELHDYSEESDDMQTDCAQMTSLVNVFNTSLGGLCSDMSRSSNDESEEADDESSDEESDDVFYTNLKPAKSINYPGLSDKGNIYCGSNVVDSVTMPTPIALTV